MTFIIMLCALFHITILREITAINDDQDVNWCPMQLRERNYTINTYHVLEWHTEAMMGETIKECQWSIHLKDAQRIRFDVTGLALNNFGCYLSYNLGSALCSDKVTIYYDACVRDKKIITYEGNKNKPGSFLGFTDNLCFHFIPNKNNSLFGSMYRKRFYLRVGIAVLASYCNKKIGCSEICYANGTKTSKCLVPSTPVTSRAPLFSLHNESTDPTHPMETSSSNESYMMSSVTLPFLRSTLSKYSRAHPLVRHTELTVLTTHSSLSSNDVPSTSVSTNFSKTKIDQIADPKTPSSITTHLMLLSPSSQTNQGISKTVPTRNMTTSSILAPFLVSGTNLPWTTTQDENISETQQQQNRSHDDNSDDVLIIVTACIGSVVVCGIVVMITCMIKRHIHEKGIIGSDKDTVYHNSDISLWRENWTINRSFCDMWSSQQNHEYLNNKPPLPPRNVTCQSLEHARLARTRTLSSTDDSSGIYDNSATRKATLDFISSMVKEEKDHCTTDRQNDYLRESISSQCDCYSRSSCCHRNCPLESSVCHSGSRNQKSEMYSSIKHAKETDLVISQNSQ